ncbi:MAG TPA: crossover junction endodeoxyribonuclease RuvC [bacterium]|nr:crossover junction endodeoxyribonuclease RuvC [bacterium]
MPTPIRVLGLDPSLRCTGYGVVDFRPDTDASILVEGGVIRTPSGARLEERVLIIHRAARDLLTEFVPDVVAIEDLFTRFKNPRTAILMAHGRGVLLLACAQAGVPVVPYAPRLIKNAIVAHGGAQKHQIQARVQAIFGLANPPEPADVADALAIALTHIQRALRRQEPAPILNIRYPRELDPSPSRGTGGVGEGASGVEDPCSTL